MSGCFSYTAARDRWYRRSFSSAGLRCATVDIHGGETTVQCWVPRFSDPWKPSVILIHGFGAKATWQWDPLLRPLLASFNVYVPDLLFFGGSFTTRSERTESFQADCVVAAMDALGVWRASLVGISYGGFVGYQMAAAYPDRVERVVLCCAGVSLEERDLREGLFVPEIPHQRFVFLCGLQIGDPTGDQHFPISRYPPAARFPPLSSPPLPCSRSSAAAAAAAGRMELFRRGDLLMLRSWHGLYLTASEDGKSVSQEKEVKQGAIWTVESVDYGGRSAIRLKSSRGSYLAASNEPFLLGFTGHKVLQALEDHRLDSSVVWTARRSGTKVALDTLYGHSLRANFGLPPWSSSVTHDKPQLGFSQDWTLWDVEKMDLAGLMTPLLISDYCAGGTSVHSSSDGSPLQPSSHERTVAYSVVDDSVRRVVLKSAEIRFKGGSLEDLTAALRAAAAVPDAIVCSRHPKTGNLYRLRLRLAPGKQKVEVVLVRASSRVGRELMH